MKIARGIGTESVARGRRNIHAVSLRGLVMRITGVTIWGLAHPESLPVPPLRGEEGPLAPALTGSRRAIARAIRVASVAMIAAALGAVAIGALAFNRLRMIQTELMENPDGDTLLQQADRLETSLEGIWWARFYPDYPQRIARLAQEVRDGRNALVEAAVSYAGCSEALGSRGLPARLVDGEGIVTPLVGAMRRVPTQFHRETVTYLQMESEMRPYVHPDRNRSSISGVLSSCPPGHALMIMGMDRDGAGRWSTATPIREGKDFEIPLQSVATVRLTDMYKASGATGWEIVDRVDVPFETWDDGPVRFPAAGSRFEVRFAREKAVLAPRPAKLSSYSRSVIAPLPAALRGG